MIPEKTYKLDRKFTVAFAVVQLSYMLLFLLFMFTNRENKLSLAFLIDIDFIIVITNISFWIMEIYFMIKAKKIIFE